MSEKEVWKSVINQVLKENEPWNRKYDSDKYHVVFDNNKMPPKVVLKRVFNLIQAEYPEVKIPRVKGGLRTNQFLEEYGATITEDLKFNTSEKKEFLSAYSRIKNNRLFQQFIDFGNRILKENDIDPYKVRMAINSSNKFFVVIGMREVFAYAESNGKSEIGFLVKKRMLKKYNNHPNYLRSENYNRSPEQWSLIMNVGDLLDIDGDLLQHHLEEVKLQYDATKKTKRTQWNLEAKTTNSVLKYLMFNKIDIKHWISDMEDVKKINIEGEKVYKLSMGTFLKTKKFRDHRLYEYFENNNMGVMSKYTSNGQGDDFVNKLQIDDFLYVTYGKDRLGGLYRVTSDIKELPNEINEKIGDEGYVYRDIEKIANPNIPNTNKLVDDKRSWLPSGYSTLVEIYDIEESNRILFQPYFGIRFLKKDFKKMKEDINTPNDGEPLNQILYGPPGTGKTFATREMAVKIANRDFRFDGDNKEEYRKAIKKEYERLETLGQIVFTTFHQSMGYEDFVEGIKPSLEKETITYKIESGIFKSICKMAGEENEATNFEEAYSRFIEDVQEKGMPELKTLSQKKPFNVRINSNESAVAIPQTEKATEMSITKEMLREYAVNGVIRDWKPYTTSIVQYLKDEYNLTVKKVDNPNKNFVLIIDEINRGNVSSIFGELITLIEANKRLDAREELKVKLPYSKKEFGVPSNLYVIGTMNTADRSVEALDSALRRRFSFVEKMPNPDLLENREVAGVNLKKLLEVINKRIEALLDRDHTIGHSYFFEVLAAENREAKLKEVFRDNIVPLLQEYFFGDYSKIGLVLGEGFVTAIPPKNENIFSTFNKGQNSVELVEKYELKTIDEDFNISDALQKLMV